MIKIFKEKSWLILLISLILAFITAFLLQNRPTGVSFKPINDPEIPIKFDSNLEFYISSFNPDIQTINIAINPPTPIAQKLEKDKLTISPQILNFETDYEIYIFVNGNIQEKYNFKVLPKDKHTQEELAKFENLNLSKALEDIKSSYSQIPWIENLPIIKDEYLITYDFQEKYFRVRIWNSDNLNEEELQIIKEDALFDLIDLGATEDENLIFILD